MAPPPNRRSKSNLARGSSKISRSERKPELLRKTLQELHDLLEEYAPSWYTEQRSKQLEAALAGVSKGEREF